MYNKVQIHANICIRCGIEGPTIHVNCSVDFVIKCVLFNFGLVKLVDHIKEMPTILFDL